MRGSFILGILIGRYYGLAIMAVGCLSFAVMFVTLISMPVVKDPNESKKEEQKNTANRQRGGGILEFCMSLSELYAGIAGNDINLCRKYICEQLSDQYCGKLGEI